MQLIEHISDQLSSDCQRLFHGRGHCYPGYEHINIDWLPPVLLITLYKEIPRTELDQLAADLRKRFTDVQSIQVQYRYQQQGPIELLWGEALSQIVVNEAGLKFQIELGRVRNTGLFLDMRNGRHWLREHAKDKNVLNLFAYTCAFSVAAIAGGAKQVINVDNNKSVLSRGRDNHRLNAQDLNRVKFEGVDIFKSYSRIKRYAPYDILICDPPSFQAGSVNIERDYKKIISRIPQWMNPGSELMLCLNSPDLSQDFLLETVENHCPQCHLVEKIDPPPVFKEATSVSGLKVMIFSFRPV